jgi:hypothetical protein
VTQHLATPRKPKNTIRDIVRRRALDERATSPDDDQFRPGSRSREPLCERQHDGFRSADFRVPQNECEAAQADPLLWEMISLACGQNPASAVPPSPVLCQRTNS